MYAVIQTGGKQYRVQPGDIIQVEKLEGDVGTTLTFNEVLFAAEPATDNSKIWLGKPTLAGASVTAEVVGQGRGEKILIIKMKRRKDYRKTQGHRQFQTQLLVTSVANGAGGTAELSSADKQARLSKFITLLKPKGLPRTPKTLGSRSKMRAKLAASSTSGGTANAPAKAKKPAAKKATSAKKTSKPKSKA